MPSRCRPGLAAKTRKSIPLSYTHLFSTLINVWDRLDGEHGLDYSYKSLCPLEAIQSRWFLDSTAFARRRHRRPLLLFFLLLQLGTNSNLGQYVSEIYVEKKKKWTCRGRVDDVLPLFPQVALEALAFTPRLSFLSLLLGQFFPFFTIHASFVSAILFRLIDFPRDSESFDTRQSSVRNLHSWFTVECCYRQLRWRGEVPNHLWIKSDQIRLNL